MSAGDSRQEAAAGTNLAWPEPADPDQADLGRQRLEDGLARRPEDERAHTLDWMAQTGPAAMLRSIFGNSPHLTDTAIRQVDHLRLWWDEGPDAALDAALEPLAAIAGPDLPEGTKVETVMAMLRDAKQRGSLAIALADISGLWTLEQTTNGLSRMADACLQAAIRFLLLQADARGDLDLPDRADPERGCGYVVLAMGKLGASELNYSSDIDLIVLFNQEKARSARPERLAQTFQRITRDLVRIMEERTAQGYVFRTDLRLRPDPASTPIVISSAAAEIYYASLARTWERAAMIKARPCAGDIAEGERFLQEITPFVWRTSLDFAVVEEFAAMRARVAERAVKGMRISGDYDVKLGPGGIRDIEFFVQTQQLIFGGREVALRTPRTLDGLRRLAAAGHVDPTAAEELAKSYRYWRTLEHRIQMINDRQTHLLPSSEAEIEHVAIFMGASGRAALEEELQGVRETVEEHTGDLFAEAASKAPPSMRFEGVDTDPNTLARLEELGFRDPEAAFATVNGWMRGRTRATLTERGRGFLARLAPTLMERIAETGDPGATLVRWDRFIGGLPAGIQLFSLLEAHPELIDLLTDLLSAAPIIADQFTTRPETLDALLLPDFLNTLPSLDEVEEDLATALSVSRHHEESLSIVRRWMNDQRLRAAVHILREPWANERISGFLSDAVQGALAALLPLVEDEFAIRHGRVPGAGLAVLALGKLGSREMAIGSDLDLILVFDAPDRAASSDGEKPLTSSVYFARLTQRFINAITAPMKAGVLFELDMRLRPSGNAGPLATSLDAFLQYQTDNAWTWEHMALTRARPVAGDDALQERLRSEVCGLLCRDRDAAGLLQDVRDMRERIEKQFGTANPWDVKYARGGLIDISFIAQYLLLCHGSEHPDILVPDMRRALARLAGHGLLADDRAQTLAAAYDQCLQIQAYLRLASGSQIDVSQAEQQIRRGLMRIVLGQRDDPDAIGLATERLEERLAESRAIFDAIIGAD